MKKITQAYPKALHRLFAALLVFVLLASVGTAEAFAAADGKISVVSATAERGKTVAVSLKLEGNPGIWGLKLRIRYDASVLTLKSVSAGALFTQDELTMSENLGKQPYVVVASGNQLKNKTANGTVLTLHFAVSDKAANGSYAVQVEVVQANNVDGQNVDIGAQDGKVTVTSCLHTNNKWVLKTPAKCEVQGLEAKTCMDCGATLDTRTLAVTGHLNTEARNAVPATQTQAGYTGDIYCLDCGQLVAQGAAIPMLPPDPTQPVQPTQPSAPQILMGQNQVFRKGEATSLVFASDADLEDFLRAEIDGKELPQEAYTLSGAGTVLVVKPEYLDTLSGGSHTLAIVSKNGRAETTFTVEEAPAEPQTDPLIPTLLVVLGVLVAAEAVALALLIVRKRRNGQC